ncbi:amidase [Paracoccus thiocyanatus]|uniref:Amidase n=1 Tax=Paracoccus thiocyanatus TaxID=34006 RepID=A0A3D8PFT0_9RHOB|nr:amidase [Paracoccus thiocyanatus]RDW14079.1 amidase [Paracoccus thiocyanatus]
MTEAFRLSATEMTAAFARRELSPVEAARSCLDRIAAVDGRLNAFCLVDEASAMADAHASEARWMKGEALGPVDGVPTSIKDLFLTKKWPTMKGSLLVSRDQVCDVDAPAVARLREGGAVLLGKTTTTEFGHKGVGDSPLTGTTRNPWNTDLTTGGSSCGAGAAAAAMMAPLNLGSDGGGSIRIPASFCGVFGIKPGYGRVPTAPASVAGSLPGNGPLTRTVADAAAMLKVIAGYDRRDWTALPDPAFDPISGLHQGVRGMRIAYAATLACAPVEPEVAASIRDAVQVFRDLGAEVTEITLDLPDPVAVYTKILSVTLGATIAGLTEKQRKLVDPGLLVIGDWGAKVDAIDYARTLHVARSEIASRLIAVHDQFDLLLLPAMPRTAFVVGEDFPGDRGGDWQGGWTPFTSPFNLSCQPAASIPCGLDSAGLPIGLQIVGRPLDESGVLRAAQAYETTRIFPAPAL